MRDSVKWLLHSTPIWVLRPNLVMWGQEVSGTNPSHEWERTSTHDLGLGPRCRRPRGQRRRGEILSISTNRQNHRARSGDLRFGTGKPDTEIIGVVKDSHYARVKEDPYPVFYTPWRQDKEIGSLGFYVRSALPAKQTIPQIRRVMTSLDRDLPPENLRTLDDTIQLNIRSDRIVLQLAAAFAILATALAMLGLYGVMAHSV